MHFPFRLFPRPKRIDRRRNGSQDEDVDPTTRPLKHTLGWKFLPKGTAHSVEFQSPIIRRHNNFPLLLSNGPPEREKKRDGKIRSLGFLSSKCCIGSTTASLLIVGFGNNLFSFRNISTPPGNQKNHQQQPQERRAFHYIIFCYYRHLPPLPRLLFLLIGQGDLGGAPCVSGLHPQGNTVYVMQTDID